MSDKVYDALALFSGGLDSILAAKAIEEQGLKVKCLHFFSPFFGSAQSAPYWQKTYGLDIETVDIGSEFCAMMAAGPEHGFGSVLNPCLDCKILLLRATSGLLERYGAGFIVTGEVIGQRPMSQRVDAMNAIRRKAGVRDLLLRPLSAKIMEPTPMELSGLVNREKLFGFSGRGRKDQLNLAEYFKLESVPTPAGGCLLAERENAGRYWMVLKHMPGPDEGDFYLANAGRQLWAFKDGRAFWLCVGRNMGDNERLSARTRPQDAVFKVEGYPGPLAVGRGGSFWPEDMLGSAASFMASFSPKAVRAGGAVRVAVRSPEKGEYARVTVVPSRETCPAWREPSWNAAREEIRKKNGAS